MFIIIRQDHDVWMVLCVDPILIPLHVVPGIPDLQLLVAVEGVGSNGDVGSVLICKVIIGCDIWAGTYGPSRCIVPEHLPKVLKWFEIVDQPWRIHATHPLHQIHGSTTGHLQKCPQAYIVSGGLRHLERLSQIPATC